MPFVYLWGRYNTSEWECRPLLGLGFFPGRGPIKYKHWWAEQYPHLPIFHLSGDLQVGYKIEYSHIPNLSSFEYGLCSGFLSLSPKYDFLLLALKLLEKKYITPILPFKHKSKRMLFVYLGVCCNKSE